MEVKQGSHQPVFGIQVLQADGVTPRDLTGMTSAVFRMRPANGTALTITDQAMQVVNAKLGQLIYQWQDGNTATPGRYLGEVQCNLPGGPLVVPYEYNRILIAQNIVPIVGAPVLIASTFVRIVEDFGADPTGVGDSTNAFQSAITYLSGVGGGTIFCASGTYMANISINNSPSILFLSSGEVAIGPANVAAHTLSITGSTSQCCFVGFWQFLGASTGTAASIYINVNFSVSEATYFQDVKINGGYNAVLVDGEPALYFGRLTIFATRSDAVLITGVQPGFPAGGANNIWIDSLAGFSTGQSMLTVHQCTGLYVGQMDLEGAGVGVTLFPTPASAVINGTFLRNSFMNSNANGGFVLGGGPGSVISTYITGGGATNCTATGASGLSINSNVQWTYVTDMLFFGNPGSGITVNAVTEDLHITNCSCSNNTQNGITIAAAATDFHITGVTAKSNTGYGIIVVAVPATYYTIQGCIVRSNTAGDINDGATGTPKRSVTGNVTT